LLRFGKFDAEKNSNELCEFSIKKGKYMFLKNEKIRKDSAEYWDSLFQNTKFDFRKLATKSTWEKFIGKLKNKNISNILDMGSGGGHWSIILAKAGFNVKSIDVSKTALQNLKNWAKDENLDSKITLALSPIQDYCPNEEIGTNDFILCNSVLDHLLQKDIEQALENFWQLLSDKGWLYVSFDEDMDDDLGAYEILENNVRKYTSGEQKGMLWKYYTDDEIKNLLEKKFIIEEFKIAESGRRTIWARKK